jgi:peroxiredoxin (alkyl hydroperoxide reductase subunit C)
MAETIQSGIPRIGDVAPDFTQTSTHGPITFSTWQEGKWVLLFSHPADFTPVCATELVEFARRAKEFEALGTKLIGLSIDSVHSHLAWRENLHEKLDVEIGYPILADLDMKVANLYGMLHPGASATAAVRAVFVIDPKRVVRALVYYPLNVGRNVDEIKRLVTALQTADRNGCATPVNWKPGEKVIVPPPKTVDEVEERRSNTSYERIDFYLDKKAL